MASSVALLQVDTPVVARRTTRDRGRLSMIRCYHCHEDKQKCLPIDRIWPQKCDRCEKRGLSCSEGKRAQRRRKEEHRKRRAVPEISSLPTSSKTTRDEMVNDLSFLLLYRRNTKIAFSRLESLEQELIKLFPGCSSSDWLFFAAKSPLTKLDHFCEFLDCLTSLSVSRTVQTRRIEDANVEREDSLERMLWQHAHLERTHCRLCGVYRCWAMTMVGSSDSAIELLNRLSLLFDSLHTCRKHRGLIYPDLRHDMDVLNTLLPLATVRVRARLERSGLLNVLPDIAQSSPLYFPEESIYQALNQNFDCLSALGRSTDLLGRNLLHQVLDCVPQQWDQTCCPKAVYEQVAKILVRSDADIDLNKKDVFGRTPLHVACQRRCTTLARALLEGGADPTSLTLHQMQPLHFAAASGSLDLCELLTADANVSGDTVDGFGKEPLDYAVANHHPAITRLLYSMKFNDSSTAYNKRDRKVHPVLDYARDIRHVDVLDWINNSVGIP